MTEVANSKLSQQEYNIHSGDTLAAQVQKVTCVLMPRGMISAGFSDRGDLLMIRYSDYKKDLPTWILDFYEHQFINEPLLTGSEKVSSVFIANDKNLVVPDALYDETAAKRWLETIHHIEANEMVSVHQLKEDSANYLYAWPQGMYGLVTRYFPGAKIYPFSAYQFYKPYQSSCFLQCCITMDQVYATLYNNNKLAWHQVFMYENAEDIAYHIRLLCEEHNIYVNNIVFQCTMTSRSLSFVLQQLSQYFPEMKDGSGNVGTTDKNWTGTIYLLQQLYTCAL